MTNNQFTWSFSRDAIDQGLNDGNLEMFQDVPLQSLVRETAQNSIDATSKPGTIPAELSFELVQLSAKDIPGLVEEIQSKFNLALRFEHDKGSKADKDAVEFTEQALDITQNSSITALKVSDRNTTGATGNLDERESLMFNIAGLSQQKATKSKGGGSRGVGKFVFIVNSPIRTYLCVSNSTDGIRMSGYHHSLSHAEENGLLRGRSGTLSHRPNSNSPRKAIEATDIPEVFRTARKEKGVDFYILGFQNKPITELTSELREHALRNLYKALWENEITVKLPDGSTLSKDNVMEEAAKLPTKDDGYPYGNTADFLKALQQPAYQGFETDKVVGKHRVHLLESASGGQTRIHCFRKDGRVVLEASRIPQGIPKNKSWHAVYIADDPKDELRAIEQGNHQDWFTQKNRTNKARTAAYDFIKDRLLRALPPPQDSMELDLGGLLSFTSLSGKPKVSARTDAPPPGDAPRGGRKPRPNPKPMDKGIQVPIFLDKAGIKKGKTHLIIHKESLSDLEPKPYLLSLELNDPLNGKNNRAIKFQLGTRSPALRHTIDASESKDIQITADLAFPTNFKAFCHEG